MVLADDVAKLIGAQLIGKRPRRVTVEAARRKKRLKHGGQLSRDQLPADGLAVSLPLEDVVAVDEALEKLAATDPQAAELVKLHYFAGLTVEEAQAYLPRLRALLEDVRRVLGAPPTARSNGHTRIRARIRVKSGESSSIVMRSSCDSFASSQSTIAEMLQESRESSRRSTALTLQLPRKTMQVVATSATNTPVVSKFMALSWMR